MLGSACGAIEGTKCTVSVALWGHKWKMKPKVNLTRMCCPLCFFLKALVREIGGGRTLGFVRGGQNYGAGGSGCPKCSFGK